jgi:hypothetical protein
MRPAVLAADGGSDKSDLGALGPLRGLTQIHPDEDVHAAVSAVARNALGATDVERRLIRLAAIDRLDAVRSEWSVEQHRDLVDAYYERAALEQTGGGCTDDWPAPRDLPGLPAVRVGTMRSSLRACGRRSPTSPSVLSVLRNTRRSERSLPWRL